MNNDPIAGMTEQEVRASCYKILGITCSVDAYLVGLIIAKLQEWGCQVSYYPIGHSYGDNWFVHHRNVHKDGYNAPCNPSLQVAFLHTAAALGHWTPPQKQLTIEERVQNIEKEVRNISHLLKI